MASFLQRARSVITSPLATPLHFPKTGFPIVPRSVILEEEQFEGFRRGLYYPVKIGEILDSRYQVLGKLGYGISSTVWLGHDLRSQRYIALKVYTHEQCNLDEMKIYQKLENGDKSHPGYRHVRRASDKFAVQGRYGRHECLVLSPMWDSFRDILRRNPTHRFTLELLKGALIQIFRALDYLHTKCRVIHTDIKADNILLEIEDPDILDAFTSAELQDPSPRKNVNGFPVYQSRTFDRPKDFGAAVLSDFGAAVSGLEPITHNAQPNVYRSPEVMLKIPWSYPIDIWNVGVMIWDLFEGKHMFHGDDPDGKGYSTRAHLAELIGMFGMPPPEFIRRGKGSDEFFTQEGKWKAGIEIPRGMSLDSSEEYLNGEDKQVFLNFMRGMLQWRPEDRKTAKQLLQDPYLVEFTECV